MPSAVKNELRGKSIEEIVTSILGREGDAATLQGLVVTKDDEAALINALEEAFDYRGDVTIHTTSGESVEGFIFDRVKGDTLADSHVRLLPPKSDDKRTIAYRDIASLDFTGKDTAHGKSFESYLRKFVTRTLESARERGDID
ncbi:MAG: hypothetical protein AAGD00_11030 [Planctomycetota bacterium]